MEPSANANLQLNRHKNNTWVGDPLEPTKEKEVGMSGVLGGTCGSFSILFFFSFRKKFRKIGLKRPKGPSVKRCNWKCCLCSKLVYILYVFQFKYCLNVVVFCSYKLLYFIFVVVITVKNDLNDLAVKSSKSKKKVETDDKLDQLDSHRSKYEDVLGGSEYMYLLIAK
ncbi:MAG: hypothetical protein FWG55_08395 [Candidatus Bathyarchaeota archaeon]|nr:hypothetical protein [Candidatus Termiticorpusculum sp.]